MLLMDRGAPTVNHTRNIQGKGIERLPYPWWVSDSRKRQAATITRRAVHQLQAGELVETDTIAAELIWRVVCQVGVVGTVR